MEADNIFQIPTTISVIRKFNDMVSFNDSVKLFQANTVYVKFLTKRFSVTYGTFLQGKISLGKHIAEV